MRLSFKGHFDGHAIVPDEPVELPVGEPLVVDVASGTQGADAQLVERLAAVERMASRAVRGVNLPAEALRRDAIYGDD